MNKRTVVKIRPLGSEIYKANDSSESNEVRKIVLELETPCLRFLLLSVGIWLELRQDPAPYNHTYCL
jgi:hypothetical protein